MIIQLLASSNNKTFNLEIAHRVGLHAAIILAELCDEYLHWQATDQLEDDCFFSSRDYLEQQTTLSVYQQREAINKLVELNLVSVESRGMPKRNFYRLHADNILNLCSDLQRARNSTTRERETRLPESEKLDLSNNKELNNNTKDKELNNKRLKNKELFKTSKSPSSRVPALFEMARTYSDDSDVQQALIRFVQNSLDLKKTLTVTAFEMQLVKLSAQSFTAQQKLSVINDTISRGWITLDYVLDQKNKTKQNSFDNTASHMPVRMTKQELDKILVRDENGNKKYY